jgi:branched-chain amino acid transport system substrate-binding protein
MEQLAAGGRLMATKGSFRMFVISCLIPVGALSVLAFQVSAFTEDEIKIGFLAPLEGPYAQNGRQMVAGMKYFLQESGTVIAGRKVTVILRDDYGKPDLAKRVAQDLVVNEKVEILAGFNLTPAALAVAPLSAQAKIPMIVTASAGASVTTASPYLVRTFFTLPEAARPLGKWSAENRIKRVVTMVSDFAPGYEAEKAFSGSFQASGGEVVEALRVPVQNPDFAPFLQRAQDAKPDAIFLFVPGNFAGTFARQYTERGLNGSGIKLIGTGDITDDDILEANGSAMLGVITTHQYSAAHPSAINKQFVDSIAKMNGGMRANYLAVAAYDGMRLIFNGLNKTGGVVASDELIAAMKGSAWESPRGPVSIDPNTREILQNMYMREVKELNGHFYNVEFSTITTTY